MSILQDPNRVDEKRNLLPNLYKFNFFESLFEENEIELNPQGSIGIDIGVRYLKEIIHPSL